MPSGFIVQSPVAGKLNISTLPVAVSQVGCVIVPTLGDEGFTGCALIVTAADVSEVHPSALVTIKL